MLETFEIFSKIEISHALALIEWIPAKYVCDTHLTGLCQINCLNWLINFIGRFAFIWVLFAWLLSHISCKTNKLKRYSSAQWTGLFWNKYSFNCLLMWFWYTYAWWSNISTVAESMKIVFNLKCVVSALALFVHFKIYEYSVRCYSTPNKFTSDVANVRFNTKIGFIA